MALIERFPSIYISFCCVLFFIHRTYSDEQPINSFEILESLSELALLRHHPQSIYSNSSISESFNSLIEDLRNQNLSVNHPNVNCSALNQSSLATKSLCENGALFKCMSSNEMLQLVPETTKSVSEALARLCPLLLLQLHSNCESDSETSLALSLKPTTAAVWGYGLLFVTIISCCSLVGVIILPLLSKHVYHTVLMLFEGLAVGSLVGSSLFHLIPQTFNLSNQEEEKTYLSRSLLIFGGIYLFYFTERVMKFFIDIRKEHNLKRSGYIPGESSTEFLKSVPDLNGTIMNPAHLKIEDCDKEKGASNGLPILTAESLNNQNHYKLMGDDIVNDAKAVKPYGVDSEHGHHHDHSVNFEKGKSAIGTVAWMIIFGDGLHNFIDGLSIGAAFSESILSGVSISVAVICEEFPHELGDFAILLSAGMSMKQALCYNFLSALTCYLGLVLGILLGDLAEGAPYIFALAGGMFLYIALVDMMGELSEALEEARQKGWQSQLKVFFIQNIGIGLGVTILFVMAWYAEHFNFENLTNFSSTPDKVLDDKVHQIYAGLQEAKLVHGSLSSL